MSPVAVTRLIPIPTKSSGLASTSIMADNPVAKAQKEAAKSDFLPTSSTQSTDENAQRKEDSKNQLLAELRDKNRKETTFDFQMMGDLRYTAGITVQLDDSFGNFQGKYLLDKVVHKIGRSGYSADLSGHKTLEGYESQSAHPPKAPATKAAKDYSPGDVSGSPTPSMPNWVRQEPITHPWLPLAELDYGPTGKNS